MTANMLEIDNLSATIRTGGQPRELRNWSQTFLPGLYAVIGPSGIGKTSLMLGLIGWPRRNVLLTGGDVRIGKTSILAATAVERRRMWGGDILFVPQSSATALKARRPVIEQLGDFPSVSGRRAMFRAELDAAATRLGVTGLGDGRNPQQFSGGQLQRLMLAPLFALAPRLVLLDEPTTGLQVELKRGVIDMVRQRIAELGAVGLLITHESAYFRDALDGEVDLGALLSGAAQRDAAGAARAMWRGWLPASRPPGRQAEAPLRAIGLSLSSLSVRNPSGAALVDNVSLDIPPGQAVCLTGPSGSGKTTLLRAIAGQHRHSSGRIAVGDEMLAGHYSGRTRRQRRLVGYVPQSVRLHLNPRLSVGFLLHRSLRRGGGADEDLPGMLDLLALPRRYVDKLGSELSGGECQRLGIAMALAEKPPVLLLDEVTASLDPVNALRIALLLRELRDRRETSILFSTHDPQLIDRLADAVVRLEHGHIVAGAMAAGRRRLAERERGMA